MAFLRRATAKLFMGPKLDDLAHSSPITEQNADAIPNFALPYQYTADPVALSIVSPLEQDYIRRPVTVQGEHDGRAAQHMCRLSDSHSAAAETEILGLGLVSGASGCAVVSCAAAQT